MQDLTAKRTLVKSPPELWNELSEVDRLARHLDAFGEIKITKLEPEHTVAWEGEGASGTVSIEPSGWGTKVTLTAQVEEAPAVEPEPADPPETTATEDALETEPPAAEAPAEPEPEPEPEAPPRRGLFARLFGRRTVPAVEPAAEPAEQPEPAAEAPEPAVEPDAEAADPPEPPPSEGRDVRAILDDVLEALGSAHHRPFSRG
jgi:hypothetical protein